MTRCIAITLHRNEAARLRSTPHHSTQNAGGRLPARVRRRAGRDTGPYGMV